MVTAVVSGVLFGLAPAWRSAQADPQNALKAQGRSVVGRSRRGVGWALVAGQVALSFVLLTSARSTAQFVPESHHDTCRLPAQRRAAGQHGVERHQCRTHRCHSRAAARVAGGAVGGVLDDDTARQRRRNHHGCSRRRAGDRQDRRPVGDQPRQRELLRHDGHAIASGQGHQLGRQRDITAGGTDQREGGAQTVRLRRSDREDGCEGASRPR